MWLCHLGSKLLSPLLGLGGLGMMARPHAPCPRRPDSSPSGSSGDVERVAGKATADPRRGAEPDLASSLRGTKSSQPALYIATAATVRKPRLRVKIFDQAFPSPPG